MNWLLLRGLSREQRHWGDFPNRLAEATGGRAFCLDLPGTGTEHLRSSPVDMLEITEDVRSRWQFLRAANPGEWMIFGISLGGMVTMDWVARHPDEFTRAVIVNSSAANMSVPWKRMDWRVIPKVARSLFNTDHVARERTILGFTTTLRTDLDEVATKWAAFQADRPIRRSLVVRQLAAAARFPAPAKLEIPALIVSGGKDPLMDPSCPRRLAAHFGAPLEVHPDAGHELALDAPEWLADRVATWVRAGEKSAA